MIVHRLHVVALIALAPALARADEQGMPAPPKPPDDQVFAHHYVGVNPVLIGEQPLAFFKNPRPHTDSAPDVDVQRDESSLTGGTNGFVNTPFRSLATSSPTALNYLWAGLFQLNNRTSNPGPGKPVAENAALEAQLNQIGTGPGWSFLAETLDNTNLANPQQPIYAEELDYRGLGADDNEQRAITRSYISGRNRAPGEAMEVFTGLELNAINPATQHYRIGIHLNAPMQIGFDCYDSALLTIASSRATACLRMKDNQAISMSTDQRASFRYDPSGAFLWSEGTASEAGLAVSGPFEGYFRPKAGVIAPVVRATESTQSSYAGPLTAAGSDQATALALSKDTNWVATVPVGAGVVLPSVPGQKVEVFNRGASSLRVYPSPGATIESTGTNAAVTLGTKAHATFTYFGSGQYLQEP